MLTLIAVLITLLIAGCVYWVFYQKIHKQISEMNVEQARLEADNENQRCAITQLERELNDTKQKLGENNEIKNKQIELEVELKSRDERIDELKKDKQTTEENYKNLFEKLKNELQKDAEKQDENVFNRVSLMFNSDSRKILGEIFDPIKKSVDEYSKELIKNDEALKQHIENAFKYSNEMQQNAEKLATILKGNHKVRGNFGELQLKNVLEKSGLTEGEQYKLQTHFKEEGKGGMPDAVVYLDGGEPNDKNRRCIIIDSKFPLPNKLLSDSDEVVIQEDIAKEIADNLKERINELSKKPYEKFNEYTYDFTLLFLPYNNILDLALSADCNIYQYGYKKKIYLVTPHTLFMALKTIHISWQHIKRQRNVEEAFNLIDGLCDKFVTAMETFKKIQGNIKTLQGNVETLDNQLIYGKDNLSSKFEKLKNCGAMPKKSLPYSEGS